jgi:hypothetical protein
MTSDVLYVNSVKPGRALIDLKLAASYAPGIICVGKSVLLFALCYLLKHVFWMGLTDRCVAICIILIDTNACVSVAFFGVSVSELRNTSTFIREGMDLWPWTYICSMMWYVYSCFLLHVGELYISTVGYTVITWIRLYFLFGCNTIHNMITTKTKNVSTISSTTDVDSECYEKNSTWRKERKSHFTPLLVTAVLLYLTCNVPVLADLDYDLEIVIRVFCFVSTSLLWLYTLNVEQMESHTIASFTPCVNRFMVLLLAGPLILTVIVYILMISMIVYRGWDLLANAVVSSSIANNTGISESNERVTTNVTTPKDTIIGVTEDVNNVKPYKPMVYPKPISIIGMPTSGLQYPDDELPFDPEAAFAEISKAKAVTDLHARSK